MRQRAYLAMQLALDSPYMVMDEPMNYLDYPSQRDMFRLVKELVKRDKTIIMVHHDLKFDHTQLLYELLWHLIKIKLSPPISFIFFTTR